MSLTRKQKIDLAYTALMTSYYNSGSLGAIIHDIIPLEEKDMSYNDRILLGAAQDYLRAINRLMEAWNTYSALEPAEEEIESLIDNSVIDDLLSELEPKDK